ncbi:MAG: hypothetical protein IIB33_01930 [Chloroflexi bacterium]|nr:hypothetical protein [Chloroflexota bacterium]
MRKNTMKAKMEAGEPAVGVSLTFPSPHMVEVMVMASELAGNVPHSRRWSVSDFASELAPEPQLRAHGLI